MSACNKHVEIFQKKLVMSSILIVRIMNFLNFLQPVDTKFQANGVAHVGTRDYLYDQPLTTQGLRHLRALY